jgi:IclR family pca regulon transcriptional regulator
MPRLRPEDAARRVDPAFTKDFSEGLARGLSVLKAFDAAHRHASLSEIARLVDLPRATTRRALHTLVMLGYVEMDGRQFRLAPRVLELAAAYLTSNAAATTLQPACERLCREAGESCTAAVLDGAFATMIARALPAQLMPVGQGIGYRLPAFNSALGRVLLAALPDPDLDAWFAALEPVAHTPFTLLDKTLIRAAVISVRQDGFAYVDQEAEFGFHSIAVPVTRYDGAPVAALNIGARVERVSSERMRRAFLPLLVREAEALGRVLI